MVNLLVAAACWIGIAGGVVLPEEAHLSAGKPHARHA